jgi:hypothetical protein
VKRSGLSSPILPTRVERFCKGIVGGVSRASKVELDAIVVSSLIGRFRGELRSLIASNCNWCAAFYNETSENSNGISSAKSSRNVKRWAFAREVIDDR